MSRPKNGVITKVKGDRQVWPLYWAERTFQPRTRYAPTLTKKRARTIIALIRKWYGLPRIALTTVNAPRWNESASASSQMSAAGELQSARIRFNTGRRPILIDVLLHEVAHVVTDYIYGPENKKIEPHGKEFAGVVTYLYDRFQVIPEDALNVIWRRYKIRHKTAVESSPRALKPFRKRRLNAQGLDKPE